MNLTQVEESLNDLIDEVEVALNNVSSGKDFGLSDISERIAEVCAAATSLPEEEVVLIQPLLQRLRDDLENFSSEVDIAKSKAGESPVENES